MLEPAGTECTKMTEDSFFAQASSAECASDADSLQGISPLLFIVDHRLKDYKKKTSLLSNRHTSIESTWCEKMEESRYLVVVGGRTNWMVAASFSVGSVRTFSTRVHLCGLCALLARIKWRWSVFLPREPVIWHGTRDYVALVSSALDEWAIYDRIAQWRPKQPSFTLHQLSSHTSYIIVKLVRRVVFRESLLDRVSARTEYGIRRNGMLRSFNCPTKTKGWTHDTTSKRRSLSS